VFGHTHRCEVFGRVIDGRHGQTVVQAVNPGCMCRTDYVVPGHKRGQNWQTGLAVIRYEVDGSARPEIVLIGIENGRALFDGQVFEASEMEVVGQTNPGTHLALVNGRYRAETRSSSEGKFTFSDVRLSIGPNTIMVLDLDHLTWEQARASIRVVRQEQLAPFWGHKDPLTNAPLVEGEPVVRCSICWTYCYLSSWRANGNCSICCMRGLTPRHWTSDDDEFYMTREELNRR